MTLVYDPLIDRNAKAFEAKSTLHIINLLTQVDLIQGQDEQGGDKYDDANNNQRRSDFHRLSILSER